jgi:hypothetical protein
MKEKFQKSLLFGVTNCFQSYFATDQSKALKFRQSVKDMFEHSYENLNLFLA